MHEDLLKHKNIPGRNCGKYPEKRNSKENINLRNIQDKTCEDYFNTLLKKHR